MVYDKKKIFPLDKKKLTISFVKGSQAQISFLRRSWEILEYHLRDQLDFRWVRSDGEITVKFDDTDSRSYIGCDGLHKWNLKSKPSMKFRDTHSFSQRIILHEAFHMLGCKHQHDENELKRSSRFGVNMPDDEKSIMRYRQTGEQRNHHLSLGDIDFLHRYDSFREIGEKWRNHIQEEKEKVRNRRIASLSK